MIKILAIILIVIIVLVVAIGLGTMIYVDYPKGYSYEEAIKREAGYGFPETIDDLPHEELDLTMDDGYLLHGILLKQPTDSKKYVIISHGYTYNRMGSVKYALIFYKKGYNAYIYDLRRFGGNKKTFCSMGYNEGRDIANIARLLREKYGSDIEIGLHGESLGAASSVLALGYDDSIKFAVADCPYSDCGLLFEELAVAWYHLPRIMGHACSIAQLIFHGYRFDSVKPIDSFLKNEKTAVCFIHGEVDDFIVPEHSKRMYEVCKGYKEIHLMPKANHAQSMYTDKVAYTKIVDEFLDKIEAE